MRHASPLHYLELSSLHGRRSSLAQNFGRSASPAWKWRQAPRSACSPASGEVLGTLAGPKSSVWAITAHCPSDPSGVGIRHSELTSPNPAWRERAIRWTKITIDYAAGLEASYVILRLGGNQMPGFTADLYRQVRDGGLYSRRFVTAKLRGIQQRARESAPWLTRAKASLDVLLPYATERGIRLAILGTGNYEEGPTETEILELLNSRGKDGTLGYWHDFSQTAEEGQPGIPRPRGVAQRG